MHKNHCRPEHHEKPKHCGLFFGGALVIMGTGYLLFHLGMLGALRPWMVWPAVPIWGGLLNLLGGCSAGQRVWGLILTLFGAAFGAHYLGVLPLEARIVWPMLVIAVGLVILVAAAFRKKASELPSSGARDVDIRSVFSGREDRNDSQVFRGGRVHCRFGGYKLDLARAEIDGDEAVIEVDLVMGGLELIIPRHWTPVVDVSPVMGGVENKTRVDDWGESAKRLVIRGSVVMGGVEIKN